MDLPTEGLRELSLFSGAGGGLLGTTWLLGWQTVCYVEWDAYAQRVLQARIRDGLLHDAPIWSDVQTFDAMRWRGRVDVVSAGFPCQSFSVAGRQLAGDDPKNQWPATIDTIRIIRPRYVFLENVPGLLAGSHGYFGHILGELADAGYDVRWCVLSAEDCGAPHRRARVWIRGELRDADSDRESAIASNGKVAGMSRMVADADSDALRQQHAARPSRETSQPKHNGEARHLADADSAQCKGNGRAERAQAQHADASGAGWWLTEPSVGRVADGVAARMDRLRAIGNGQVPIVAARAWEALTCGAFT